MKKKIYKELVLQANPEEIGFTKVSEISEDVDGDIAEMMAYAPGDDEVEIHCYSVFVRNHDAGTAPSWATSIAAITEANTNLKETGVDWWAEAPAADGTIAAAELEDWGLIGRLEEKPSIKTSSGETVNFEDCNEKDISEAIEVNLNHLQVNAGNWLQLRALAKSGNVDFLFVEKDKLVSGSANVLEGAAVSNIKMRVHITITGNAKNEMPITAKKTVGDATTNFALISVTSNA